MEQKTILVLTNNIGGLHSFRKEVMKAMVDEGYKVVISHPDEDDRIAYFTGIGCEDVLTEFNRRGMNPIMDAILLLRYKGFAIAYEISQVDTDVQASCCIDLHHQTECVWWYGLPYDRNTTVSKCDRTWRCC